MPFVILSCNPKDHAFRVYAIRYNIIRVLIISKWTDMQGILDVRQKLSKSNRVRISTM